MSELPVGLAVRRTLHSPQSLLEAGLIAPDKVQEAALASETLSIGVTPEMINRIYEAGLDSGVAKQFLPSIEELQIAPHERADPIGDSHYVPVKGITHRYPDRLLLTPLHACAVYCRFCFRREKVGVGEEYLTAQEMRAALDYIRSKPQVREVILTGGDPLILSPRRLREIVAELVSFPNIDVVRFHTRIPVVSPELINSELLAALDNDKIMCVVVHANHADEFGPAARAAIKRLRKAGVMLVSHSVLLKGVNDTVQALTDLFREFVRNGIKPYYLHHCDLAEGISHFRTTFDEGIELMRQLRGWVSGLALPTYVLHIPDGHGKVPIAPSYIQKFGEAWEVTDYKGGRHAYPPRD